MTEDEKVLSPPKLDLELMSVDDLRTRIEALSVEIEACEAEIAKKISHKSAANALFGGDG